MALSTNTRQRQSNERDRKKEPRSTKHRSDCEFCGGFVQTARDFSTGEYYRQCVHCGREPVEKPVVVVPEPQPGPPPQEPTEQEVEAELSRLRWQRGLWCPHCNERAEHLDDACDWIHRCDKCGSIFTVRTMGVMEGSDLPASVWSTGLRSFIGRKFYPGPEELAEQTGLEMPAATEIHERMALAFRACGYTDNGQRTAPGIVGKMMDANIMAMPLDEPEPEEIKAGPNGLECDHDVEPNPVTERPEPAEPEPLSVPINTTPEACPDMTATMSETTTIIDSLQSLHRSSAAILEWVNDLEAQRAHDVLNYLRWPAGVTCPRCGNTECTKRNNQSPQPFYCSVCRQNFGVRTDNFMSGIRIGPKPWLGAIMCAVWTNEPPAEWQLSDRMGRSTNMDTMLTRLMHAMGHWTHEAGPSTPVEAVSELMRVKSGPPRSQPADGSPPEDATAPEPAQTPEPSTDDEIDPGHEPVPDPPGEDLPEVQEPPDADETTLPQETAETPVVPVAQESEQSEASPEEDPEPVPDETGEAEQPPVAEPQPVEPEPQQQHDAALVVSLLVDRMESLERQMGTMSRLLETFLASNLQGPPPEPEPVRVPMGESFDGPTWDPTLPVPETFRREYQDLETQQVSDVW